MGEIEALIDRLAKGPVETTRDIEWCVRNSPWYETTSHGSEIWPDFVRALQGSTDAALALVERVLADKTPLIGVSRDDAEIGFDNDLSADDLAPKWNAWVYGACGSAPTPALALLLALLTALKARPEPPAQTEGEGA